MHVRKYFFALMVEALSVDRSCAPFFLPCRIPPRKMSVTPTERIEIPIALQKALSKNATAKTFFETLSNSNKKRFTIPITQAKTDETRTRRVEKAILELAQHKKI